MEEEAKRIKIQQETRDGEKGGDPEEGDEVLSPLRYRRSSGNMV